MELLRSSGIALFAVHADLGLGFVHSPCVVPGSAGASISRRGAQTNQGSLRMGLADDMVPAIRGRYGAKAAERVVDAWNRGMVGDILRKEWEGKGSQVAASYVEGLDAEPWHNVEWYPWVSSLEGKLDIIRDELRLVCSNKRDGPAWVSAAEEDAEAYGPGWQKLPLQDRGWHAENCRLFPKTCGILEDCGHLSHEIFFAKQQARSGSKPHTDNSNFFITALFPLEVPDGEDCWIRVGKGEKQKWKESKALVLDSSFVHETRNDASSERIILLVRFWHPNLTRAERGALDFIFRALDDSSVLEEPLHPVLDLSDEEATLIPPGLMERRAFSPMSVKPDRGMDQTQSSASPPPADEASPAVPVPLPEKPGSPQEVESTSAKSLGSDSKNVATMTGDADSREAISVDPLGDAAEAERLDGFLADLKSEGLLPGAGTKDDVLAQGPKNRSERRKATKARKKASRPGKRKEG
ncbi:unnamed protein product [Scytosiphon promiscuus]